MNRPPPRSPLFPSPTFFRSRGSQIAPERLLDDYARPTSFAGLIQAGSLEMFEDRFELIRRDREIKEPVAARPAFLVDLIKPLDRKSTRLNSSHSQISYAVFC